MLYVFLRYKYTQKQYLCYREDRGCHTVFEATNAERRTEVDNEILILQYELDGERRGKESIIKERDALLAEKFEWKREMTRVKGSLSDKACSCAKVKENSW